MRKSSESYFAIINLLGFREFGVINCYLCLCDVRLRLTPHVAARLALGSEKTDIDGQDNAAEIQAVKKERIILHDRQQIVKCSNQAWIEESDQQNS